MTVTEIIEKLKTFPGELECIMAINQSAGFDGYDHIDVYPVDRIYVENPLNSDPEMIGYWHGNDDDKVVFYVFP